MVLSGSEGRGIFRKGYQDLPATATIKETRSMFLEELAWMSKGHLAYDLRSRQVTTRDNEGAIDLSLGFIPQET